MLDLTVQERRVLLFVLVVALAGMAIDVAGKKNPWGKSVAGLNSEITKINLNKANKDSLCSARGIGDKLAQRILQYRKENHGFKEVEDLKNIRGMTSYRFKQCRDAFVAR